MKPDSAVCRGLPDLCRRLNANIRQSNTMKVKALPVCRICRMFTRAHGRIFFMCVAVVMRLKIFSHARLLTSGISGKPANTFKSMVYSAGGYESTSGMYPARVLTGQKGISHG